MLKIVKIKDDVDLKELEKFGFEYNDDTGIYTFVKKDSYNSLWIDIRVWSRKILFRQEVSTDTEGLEVLYDLFKAGLVEKVEVKNER